MNNVDRQYKCTACHHEWPARQPADDDPLKFCPFCEHEQAHEITPQETKEGAL